MKKHKVILIVTIVFLVCLFLPWALWYAPGKLGKAVQNNCSYELNENRAVYDLEDGFENAYNDRIPFRSALIHTYQELTHSMEKNYKSNVEKKLVSLLYHDAGEKKVTASVDDSAYEWLMGKTDEDTEEDHIHDWVLTDEVEANFDHAGYSVYTCSFCHKEIKSEFAEKYIDTSYVPEDLSDTLVMTGRNDWLFLFDNRHLLDLYQGTNLYADKDYADRKETYEELLRVCEEKGTKLLFLIPPAKYQVYDEYMPSVEVEAEKKQMPLVVDYLKENSNVSICYPKDELDYVDRYYQTYFRYDSHWNQVGGYIGTMCMYRDLGLDVTPFNEVEVTEDPSNPTECVDLFAMEGLDYSDFSHEDYDFVVDYKPEVTTENTPDTAKADTEEIREMTSDVGNDLHFVLIGDSFRSQMALFVAKDFSKTTFIDRNVMGQEYAEAAGYDYEEVMAQIKEDVLDADYLVIELTEANEDLMMAYAIQVLFLFL